MVTPGTPVIFCTACGAHNQPDARFCQTCGRAMTQMQPLIATASIAAYISEPYGGFWVRFLAYIIDACIVNAVLLPFSFALGIGIGVAGSVTHMPDRGIPIAGMLTGFGLGIFVTWLYEGLMTSSSKQATLGKMVLGLRVTDLEGGRISFARATGRHFAKYLSGAILFVGYIMVGLTERKQGLHDMIVNTLVQKSRP